MFRGLSVGSFQQARDLASRKPAHDVLELDHRVRSGGLGVRTRLLSAHTVCELEESCVLSPGGRNYYTLEEYYTD